MRGGSHLRGGLRQARRAAYRGRGCRVLLVNSFHDTELTVRYLALARNLFAVLLKRQEEGLPGVNMACEVHQPDSAAVQQDHCFDLFEN
uniref:Uncharacterized protein n=1 Tax=Aegilops tauschii TaxID=37682 RepID=M8C4X0_AEGTA